jgi:16S rRNA (cytosine967-C5)-methyltransferase
MAKPLFERTHPGDGAPRLHPLLLRAVADALFQIFNENRHADKVIEQALRANPKAGARDRAFIAETTYEVVRNYRLLCEIWGKKPANPSDFWALAGILMLMKHPDEALPDWQEFKPIQPELVRQKLAEFSTQRAVKESIPDWIDELGQSELGEQWPTTLHWLNRPADVVLRANALKANRRELNERLYREDGIETESVGDGSALRLKIRRNVFSTAAFKAGWFEVQDYSSQLVAPLLAPEPGMRVVDACAGGGGKSLHLSALMQNKGSLIALDTLAWKLDELKIRARRAGATNIETRPIENRKVIKRLYGSADRLLLDVPCSGLGVIRRNPDTKWKLTAEQIKQLMATQQDIIQSYSPIVKVGGQMVYATCSILPSENSQQVKHFLASPAGEYWELISEQSILPQDAGFDGFFIALMRRKG